MEDIIRLDSYSITVTHEEDVPQYLIIPSSWINEDEKTFWYIDSSDTKELEIQIRRRLTPNDNRTDFSWIKQSYFDLVNINIDSYEEAKKLINRKNKFNCKNSNRARISKRKAQDIEGL